MTTEPEISEQRWLEEWPTRLTPLVDLVCFPGAGAGASAFRSWSPELPAFTALLAGQMPGRENRIDEKAAASLKEAAEKISAAYLKLRSKPRPLVVFGHSMGGTLAFEFARLIIKNGRTPEFLLLSASSPPTGIRQDEELGIEELTSLLLAYDQANSNILESSDLFETLVPTLHSDITLLRRHSVSDNAEKVGCTTYLMSGVEDQVVSATAVARWTCFLSGQVHVKICDGGHHFPFRSPMPNEVMTLLAELLKKSTKSRMR